MAIELGAAYVSLVPSAQGFGRQAAALIGSEVGDLGQSAPLESGGKSAGGKWGSAFKVGAIAGVGAVGVALAKGFSDALGAESVNAQIEASLGVTPERAAELGGVASGLYRDAWGDSLAEVGDAVSSVESTLGEGLDLAGIDGATEKALAFAETFGTDVPAAVSSAGQLISSGLAADADEAFDLLTAGFQSVPAAVRDEVGEAVNEYGTFFAQLGLSGEEAFGVLVGASADGAIGVDKAGDALKELTIRATDLSSTSSDAFAAAGLDAEEMANAFLAGGDTAKDAFEDTVSGLLGIEDPAERANAAIALFGAPLEDLGTGEIPGFLEGLLDLEGGLGEVAGASDQMVESIGGTNAAKIEAFKRRALGGLADFAANVLLPAFESFAAWTEANWPAIRAVVLDVFNAISGWVRENWPQIQAIITSVMTTVQEVITSVVGFVQALWSQFGDDILATMQRVWPPIQQIVTSTVEIIKGVIDAFTAVLRGDWSAFWDAILSILSGVWDNIQARIELAVAIVQGVLEAAWGLIGSAVTTAWNAVKDTITGAISDIVGAVRRLPGRLLNFVADLLEAGAELGKSIIDGFVEALGEGVSQLADMGLAMGTAIWDGIKAGLNLIIEGWNSLDPSVSVSIPSWVPGIGGKGWSSGDIIPDITPLASGGPMKSGSLYLVGEEGPELMFADRSAYVATARQSRDIVAGRSGRSITSIVNNYDRKVTPADISAGLRMARLA